MLRYDLHMRIHGFIVVVFMLLAHGAAAQTDDAKSRQWLQLIASNAVNSENGSYAKAPAGYALYYSRSGEVMVPYLVYVPRSYDPAKPISMVVFLHGAILAKEDFQHKDPAIVDEPIFSMADTFHTLVVFPFARRDFAWSGNEAAFKNILTIISQVENDYHVDQKRVYIGGISMGGNATAWFIDNKPELFAGFYTFSAMPKGNTTYSNITKNKPLYSMNAKDDQVFPYRDVAAIYEQKKGEAKGWVMRTVETGGHRFIYNGATGKNYTKALLGSLLLSSK
jgi:predicted peptidase